MSQESQSLALLKENLPTIESLIRINAPANISNEVVRAKAAEELSHFQMLSIQKPEILDCEPISVLLAVKQVIKKNLSLDPSQGLVYVMKSSVRTKEGKYVYVLDVQETANGKISVARQSGRILDIKRPTIKFDESKQTSEIEIEYLVPSVPQPRWERQTFTKDHFLKWRTASHKKNSRGKDDAKDRDYSNPLYKSWNGGIDPEFAATKAIRHALGKLGTNINESAVQVSVTAQEPIISREASDKEAKEEFTQFEEINTDQL